MFQRDIYKRLQEWSKKKNRKPLVLRGARQVGKTTLVHQFGKEFDTYIYLNLEKTEDAHLFSHSDNVKEIVRVACFQKQIIRTGKTLFFIDEIQNQPKAVALLRYFYEDMPELYVIAAGSRLQSLLKERISFPVGRVEYLQMTPCTFIEFLDATGDKAYRQAIQEIAVPELLHEQLMKLFRYYATIGGMPEIVAEYAENKELATLPTLYNTLLKGYTEDVEKYAEGERQTQIIRHILRRGWRKAGQTIKLGNFEESSYTAKDIREAFQIMEKAFLLELVYPTTSCEAPPGAAIRRAPKLIWIDTGLVNFAAGVQQEVFGSLLLTDTWRGALAEQLVAQELRYVLNERYVENLFFWVRDKQGSNAEVDFVWQEGASLIPIEVKSGSNAHLRSLQSFMDLSDGDVAIRIWAGNYTIDEVKTAKGKPFRLINLPYYYIHSIERIIREAKG